MPDLNFSVRCSDTQWGEQVVVLGSWNSWNTQQFTPLSTTPQHFPDWSATIHLPESLLQSPVEYKYAIVANRAIVRWEGQASKKNRVLLPGTLSVNDSFGKLPHKPNHSKVHYNPSAQAKPQLSNHQHIQHFEHDPSALDPLEAAIVKITSENRSWRQRLAFVRSLFTDRQAAADANFDTSSLHHLVTISAYLSFLSSGQLPCQEDGGHHRPNHHASEAQQIESALATIANSLVHDSSDASSSELYIPYVIRKIYPQLPSYSSQFTVSVPLTRIRDIAHRGDIPHDFKQEIKHTLQNKLHRCAGPEDLVTSERLLERINHGHFSDDLKHQFRIFHQELRAFFNASSLDERLEYLKHSQRTAPVSALAERVLSLKHGWREVSVQLDALTKLRHAIRELDFMRASFSSQSELPGEDMQKTRLADINLENYAFVLLAGIAKDVDAERASQSFQWPFAFGGLTKSLENMSLSSICPIEATAMASELSLLSVGHKKSNSMPHRALLLRSKAAIDRVLRFMQSFSAAISDVYGKRVQSIGRALHIDNHSLSVFAEAEVRSNVAFQASRIANTCAKVCRRQLHLPPWDPLFVGEATGKLVFLDNLSDLSPSDKSPLILVCRYADGDEDIPSSVRGVILGRPLPHLSHLGVRARQAGVIFVCAEEEDAFQAVWNKRDMSTVKLVVTSTKGLASLTNDSQQDSNIESSETENSEEAPKPFAAQIAFDGRSSAPVKIQKATKEATSSKSAFAGALLRLGQKSDGLFEVPDGMALPHGVFQTELAKHSKKYKQLVSLYDEAYSSGGDTDAASASLYDFVRTTFVANDSICRTVQKEFQAGAKVMVRSSANAEDLEEMSGAGLYDSIANVDVDKVTNLQQAIAKVWASLWTKRAASSRASYGVPHEKVSMAVLIQLMARAHASFVAFSKDPVTKDDNIYIEMAIGMGETLASATSDGSPYRFRVNRESETIETVAFASYSSALVPGDDGLQKEVVDYSKQRLTTNAEFRADVVRRVARVVQLVEREFGGPQDIEGALTFEQRGARVLVVQARPQIL